MPRIPSVYDICNSLVLPLYRPPDEYLAQGSHGPPLIPLKQRDETFTLPDSDLLNAINYYFSKKKQGPKRIFDESALLMCGYLMEHWIDEIIGDDASMYEEYEFGDRMKSRRDMNTTDVDEVQDAQDREFDESESDDDNDNDDDELTNTQDQLLSID